MDVDSSQQRMAAYMRDHQDKVVGRWSELVVAGLRGRSSAAEVRRELEDLYSLVVRAMVRRRRAGRRRAHGGAGRAVQVAGEERVHPPRDGARGVRAQGRGLRAGRRRRRPGTRIPGLLPDDRRPRPAHLRDLRGGPGADHRRPGRLHARAVHPGDQAVGWRHRGAAGRRAGLGAHPAGHGEAAGDPGRDRRGSRRAGHHRGVHGGHRGGPAPAQDGERGAPARGRVHRQRHQAAGGADDRVARHRVRRHRHQGDAGRRAGARAEPSRPAHRPAAPGQQSLGQPRTEPQKPGPA